MTTKRVSNNLFIKGVYVACHETYMYVFMGASQMSNSFFVQMVLEALQFCCIII